MRPRLRFAAAACLVFAWLGVASAQLPTTSYQGIWWATPAGSESGWGINFTHQGDVIFATWFTYDTKGRAIWLVSSMLQTGPASFSGVLYKTTGPVFSSNPFSPAAVAATFAGEAAVTFQTATAATFTYTVGNVTQSKAIVPQVFRSLPTCQFSTQASLAAASNYQGLWWASPAGSESGWGINFAHQENVIFATWFTYDSDGEPLWMVASLDNTTGANFEGTLYRTTGPSFSAAPFDPARVTSIAVGPATLQFSTGNRGTFTYTVNGVTQTKNITQQIFRDPVTVCAPAAPTVVFKAEAASVYTGSGTTLIWSSANATSCQAGGSWAGALPTSGSRWVRLDVDGKQDFAITCSGVSGSAQASASITATSIAHFSLVPNAFPDMRPIHAGMQNPILKGASPGNFGVDGKSGLVFSYIGRLPPGTVTSEPCANRVVMLIHQSDGTFTDETTARVSGSTDLGGCPSNLAVKDLNGDGRADIVYAINQEDARTMLPPALTKAQLAALISTPDGRYVVRKFGTPKMFNTIGIGYDADGTPFITAEGYFSYSAESFRVNGSDVVQTENTLPQMSTNAFEFYTDSATSKASRFLLQAGFYGLLSVEGYVRAPGGAWTAVRTLESPFPVVGTFDLLTWNKDIARDVAVMNVDGHFVAAGGGYSIPASCLLRMSPGATPVAVMQMEMPRISNYAPGALVEQKDLINTTRLVAVTIANGQVTTVPLNLDSRDLIDEAFYAFFDCKDVNGDGFDDIVAYQFRNWDQPDPNYAKPLVYLNDRKGSFRLVGLAQFPTPTVQTGDSTRALLHDFDGDGIPDLVYLPFTSGLPNPTYLFYKGVRLLD